MPKKTPKLNQDSKIRIGTVNDWELIYIDDELFHWHDGLPAHELLLKLGFDVEEIDVDELRLAINENEWSNMPYGATWEDYIPNSWSECEEMRREYYEQKRLKEIAELEERLKELKEAAPIK